MAELAQKIKSESLHESLCESTKSPREFTRESKKSAHESTAKSLRESKKSTHNSPQKLADSPKESWYERDECAGNFLLNLTIWLVKIMPKFLLNIIVIFVTLIYYAFSPKERKNLAKFYKIAGDFCNNNGDLLQGNAKKSINKPQIYLNFYHFGWAICDKIAAWIGKINHNDINIKDENLLIDELCSGKKGQILVMSHFGNIEVAHALSQKFRSLRIISFVYQKNTEKFLQMIDKVSGRKIEHIYVDEIDIKRLLELREILDNGGHIGIMGDRVALNNKRNVKMNFLGKPCYFPLGAFIIAQLLEAKISAMWCEKINGKYRVEIESLGDTTAYAGRDKTANLKPLVQKYVDSLQTHTLNNPTQWFSFYDFWESPRDLDDLDSCGDSGNDSSNNSQSDLAKNTRNLT